MPLQLVLLRTPFQKWVIDFVGPFPIQALRTQARYIITVTDYNTKWAEVAHVKDCTTKTAAKFLYENTIT